MGFYFHLAISLEKQLRKIKICQVTFSRKKKKLEKPTNKLRHSFQAVKEDNKDRPSSSPEKMQSSEKEDLGSSEFL